MIGQEPNDSFYEAGPAQSMLWAAAATAASVNSYVPCTVLRIHGPVSATRLDHAIVRLVAKHDVLRTALNPTKGLVGATPRTTPVTVLTTGHMMTAPVTEEHFLLECSRLVELTTLTTDIAAGRPIAASLARVGSNPDDHVLVVSVHHAAVDGASWPLVFAELSAFYVDDEPFDPGFRDEVAPFATVAALQGAARTMSNYQAAVDRCAAQLRNLSHACDPTVSGGHSYSVARGLAGTLRKASAELATTPSTVALAALVAHIAVQTDRASVVIGVPFDDRLRLGVSGAIGPVINTLAVRIDLPVGCSFRELVTLTSDSLFDAIDDAHVAFGDIVATLRARHQPVDAEPLPCLFQLRMHDTAVLNIPGLETTPIRIPRTSKSALEVDLRSTGDDLSIEMVGTGGILRLDAPAAARFGDFAGELIRHPDEPARRSSAADSPNPSPTYQEQQTKRETLIGLIAETARTHPHRIAISDSERSLTYAELARGVTSLAADLTGFGFRAGDPVAVSIGRSVDHVTAIAAVVEAGGWYVPIAPNEPVARADEMMRRSGAQIRIEGNLKIRRTGFAGRPLSHDIPRSGSGSPAYAMFTSGSTGTPKGVIVPHCAILRLANQSDDLKIAPGDVVAFASNPSFDAATFEIWATLGSGASIRVIDQATMLDPESLEAEIRDAGVTVMFLTTALFNAVARSRPTALAGLRVVLFGGEAANGLAARTVVDSAPSTRVVNCYGPTEGTVFSTSFNMANTGRDAVTAPIGFALHGTKLSVETDGGDRVFVDDAPTGTEGELWIGGSGVALGYIDGDHDNRFCVDADGHRWYRSGDRVLVDGGILTFLRRVDTQLKRRGHRIEPLEIEAALVTHPTIADAVVVGNDRRGRPNDELVAFAVAERGADIPDVTRLREWLTDLLPGPMLPDRIVVVEDFPRNPNDKVDRDELRRRASGNATTKARHITHLRNANAKGPALSGTALSGPTASDHNPFLEMVRAAFAHVLGGALPEADDAFFDLGGSSIALVELTAHLREVCGVALSVTTVLNAPTPEMLAARIRFALAETPEARPSGPVAVFIPCAGDSGDLFADLLLRVRPHMPTVSLRAPDADGNINAEVSVRGNADRHLAELGDLMPGSVIVGYSFGCAVALEMASSLRRRAAPPALVVLIDGRAPTSPWWHRVRSQAADARRVPPLETVAKLRQIVQRRVAARRDRSPAEPRLSSPVEPATYSAAFRHAIDERAARAVESWQARPYLGDVLYIGRSGDGRSEQNGEGWAPFVRGELDRIFFDARHYQLVGDPFAATIADEILRRTKLPSPDDSGREGTRRRRKVARV